MNAPYTNNSHDEDTDSLEIKPPQMISSRYDKHKKSSRSSRDKKHSREHRHKHRSHDRSDRHARHHSDSHSNRHHGIDTYDKYAPKDVEKGLAKYVFQSKHSQTSSPCSVANISLGRN